MNLIKCRNIHVQVKAAAALESLADHNERVQHEFLKLDAPHQLMRLLKVSRSPRPRSSCASSRSVAHPARAPTTPTPNALSPIPMARLKLDAPRQLMRLLKVSRPPRPPARSPTPPSRSSNIAECAQQSVDKAYCR